MSGESPSRKTSRVGVDTSKSPAERRYAAMFLGGCQDSGLRAREHEDSCSKQLAYVAPTGKQKIRMPRRHLFRDEGNMTWSVGENLLEVVTKPS